jgi:hypothetical protein
MPAGWRHLCHVLCTYVDLDAGVILPRFQPSLTQLARDSGLHRRTIMRHLNHLEAHGWVTRKRPNPDDARKKQARTQYAIFIGRNPQPRDIPPSDLETGDPGARDGVPSDLGTGSPVSGGGEPHQSSTSSRSSRDEEIDVVIDAIRARAGVTVTRQWAGRVAEQILGARDRVRDPAAVLRAQIGRAPRDTYAPTPAPPRFTKAKGFER